MNGADFNYRRRKTWTVNVGGIPMGGDNPIRVQSMTSTPTADAKASAAQAERIADAGGEYVRLTAQGVLQANAIGEVKKIMRKDGYNTPLVADIHFNPSAAMVAAETANKVRINPGNFVDAARTFRKLSYTDEEYALEIEKISKALKPFIELCRKNNTAVRIGVNHGSLSDRIMSRYGDTPAGMVESAMEFLRVFVAEDYLQVVISIKASNVGIMVETVRRLVKAMDAEGMHFPLHLGVTEAGDGEDGRIKSSVGIGTLLAEGLGDTIRVSLSEDPELEIPVAKNLVDYIALRSNAEPIEGSPAPNYNPLVPERRKSAPVSIIGGTNQPVVISSAESAGGELSPDFYIADDYPAVMPDKPLIVDVENWNPAVAKSYPVASDLNALESCDSEIKFLRIDASTISDKTLTSISAAPEIVVILYTTHVNVTGSIQAALHRMMTLNVSNPVVIEADIPDTDAEIVQVKCGVDLGTPLMNGFRDGIYLNAPNVKNQSLLLRYAFATLQAARLRMSHTEFISCPSCGRTLFDLQSTLKDVKEATSHLSHLKIGVMGCIVNGPGEMADADYGYVGAGPGRISLYKGKECLAKNIPQEEAIPRLVALIKSCGDWRDKQ